jgi:hypothetical protein
MRIICKINPVCGLEETMTRLKDKINDWTSSKWHKEHKWKTGTGKFLKKIMNRKVRHKRYFGEENEE